MGWIGRRVFVMPAGEVARVAQGLASSGIPFMLAGGWAVDALAGTSRRRHFDLDLLIDPDDQAALGVSLAPFGYHLEVERSPGGWWAPEMAVFRSSDGRALEILLVDARHLEHLARRATDLLGREVRQVMSRGTVGGHDVPCLSAELQLAAHTGYRLDRCQRRDARFLARMARA